MSASDEAAVQRVAEAFRNARALVAQMTPREQAEAAWRDNSPYASVDELEDQIRIDRGMAPIHDAKSA